MKINDIVLSFFRMMNYCMVILLDCIMFFI